MKRVHKNTSMHTDKVDGLKIKNQCQKVSFKQVPITLPTKVHLVKAMVFPVVMYGCESWTIKKAEH